MDAKNKIPRRVPPGYHEIIKRLTNTFFNLGIIFILLLTSGESADARPVKVGVYDNAPIVFQDKNKKFSELSVEILEYIAAKEDWDLEFVFGSWEECIKRLDNGEIDVQVYIAYSKKRALKYDYTRETLLSNWGTVYTWPGSGLETILDLEGKRVAMMQKSIHPPAFKKLINTFGIQIEQIDIGSHPEGFKLVHDKKADAVVVNRIFGLTNAKQFNIEQTHIIFNPIEIRYAMPKGKNADLIVAIDQHLKELKSDKHSLFYRAYDSAFGIRHSIFKLPKWIYLITIIAFVTILLLFFLNRTSNHIVKTRTRELQKKITELKLAERDLYHVHSNLERRVEERTTELRCEIEERKKLEKNLQEERDFLGALLENIEDGIVACDKNGILNLFNRATREFHGLPEKPLTADQWAKHYDLFLADGKTRMKKEEIPLYSAFRGNNIKKLEMVIRPKKGKKHIVQASGQPLLDIQGTVCGAVISMHDITEQKKAYDILETKVEERTRQLRESRDLAQTYLNIAGVIFAALNRAGEIILINQKGCEILNISEKKALGLNWFDHFLPPEMINEQKKAFLQLMQGKVDAAEYYDNPILTWSGEERFISFHNTLLKGSEGNITGILWSGEDITEKRQFEKEKEKLADQLQQSHKMEAIGTLAGGIAHDFNNILAAILGYADMARDETPDDSPAKPQIEEILRAGNRARNLVQQILAFSRKELHERVPIKIYPIITEALTLLRASIPTTIKIRQKLDPACGNILGDPTQIHQVVVNICTNSAQAMDEKGGVLQIDLKKVKIKTDDLVKNPTLKIGSYIQISIKDSGIGIKQEYLDRIFDPYFTTKKVGEGSGMGLAVVLGIIKGHDGMITVESQHGKCTTFNVYLPKIKEQISEVIKHAQILPGGKENILVVDDDKSIANLTKLRAERLGYQVTATTSSIDALQLFRSRPNAFDLVITDQTMPELTGEQLALKLLDIKPDLPIILCTGYSTKMDAARAKSLGIRALIMKPTDNEEFAGMIRQVLDKTI
ncbi:MAG: transporter substrate-binding domain-containing protein [Desulfobacteraceae bacterium]|nr:transporter substrate-binding domain-containing protein [Desulfobacteraceae bacterium]